jgi:hypothetical protein
MALCDRKRLAINNPGQHGVSGTSLEWQSDGYFGGYGSGRHGDGHRTVGFIRRPTRKQD